MRSIRLKLIFYFALITIIIALIISTLYYFRIAESLENQTIEALTEIAKESAKLLESRIESKFIFLETIANMNTIRGVDGDRQTTWEEKREILVEEKGRADFISMLISDTQGNADSTDGKNVDVSDRDYFKKALTGQRAISELIISRLDGTLSLALAVPIMDANNKDTVSGVLIGVIDARKFNELITDISYGESGYAYVLDSKGSILAHPDESLVMNQENFIVGQVNNPDYESYISILKKMITGEEGAEGYSLNGISRYLGYAPVKSTGWSIAVDTTKSEVMGSLYETTYIMAIIILVLLLAILLLIVFISNRIAGPILSGIKHIQAISEGDYTKEVPEEHLKLKDETGLLAASIKNMQDRVCSMLLSVKETSQNLQLRSGTLDSASREIASVTGQMTDIIQEIANGANYQSQDIHEVMDLLSDLANDVEDLYAELKLVTERTESVYENAQTGKLEIDTLSKSVESVKESFDYVLQKIMRLTDSVMQINSIIEAITGISEQTNLLALNAAIEAARAGEYGRGFSIVAEQIRKLADESKKSADSIKKLIENIRDGTFEVNETARKAEHYIDVQVSTAENTLKSFNSIMDSVENVKPLIENAFNNLDKTVKLKDILLNRTQNVQAVIEETSASTEEIASSFQEVSASTEEVATTSQELSLIAEELINRINKFKLE